MAFRPYLFFGGNCREAFTRYQEVFGGELTLLTMKDVPGEEPPRRQGRPDHPRRAHGRGRRAHGVGRPDVGRLRPVQGMMVSYDAPDVADANRVFDALAEGGAVTQALMPTFFSEAFGMCVDRFGTPWMIVGPQVPQPA